MTINEHLHHTISRSGLPESVRADILAKVSSDCAKVGMTSSGELTEFPDMLITLLSSILCEQITRAQKARAKYHIGGQILYFTESEFAQHTADIEKERELKSDPLRDQVRIPDDLDDCTLSWMRAALRYALSRVSDLYTKLIKDKPEGLMRNLACKKADEWSKYIETVSRAIETKEAKHKEREEKRKKAYEDTAKAHDRWAAIERTAKTYGTFNMTAEEKVEYQAAEKAWLEAKAKANEPTISHEAIAPMLDKKIAIIKRFAEGRDIYIDNKIWRKITTLRREHDRVKAKESRLYVERLRIADKISQLKRLLKLIKPQS